MIEEESTNDASRDFPGSPGKAQNKMQTNLTIITKKYLAPHADSPKNVKQQ